MVEKYYDICSMYLLKHHKNSIFKTIEESDMNPSDFMFADVKNKEQIVGWGIIYTPEPAFKFQVQITESEFYSRIGFSAKSSTIISIPGIESVEDTDYLDKGSVSATYPFINVWLANLKREIETEDLWDSLAKGTYKRFANQKDSIEDVRNAINLLSEHVKNLNLNVGQKQYLINQFNTVINVYQQNPDCDWRNILQAIIISAIINMTIDTETGKALYEFAKTIFHKLISA